MTSFISDQDFTTPAHIRVTLDDVKHEDRGREPRRGQPGSAAPFHSMVLLAAVWLVVSAVPIGYLGAGRYDVFWSDAVVGITIAIITTIRLLHPLAPFAWVIGGLAGWLLAAPLVLQYGWSAATANDLIVGVLILACTLLGAAD
ncbi:hypothetical protein ACFFX1_04260 [Dactylosporangium sucinum]|uniref:SPW repeat-containing integral membrane domain-containing protein n=1 Tax=Dactylosporangium sucinum TaxID=1424081 RepID=A0A917WM94_9ACTN|nr:hypothetical protein [Dactylosporangium sucinum]GGM14820.1 hypothetical protein GCM10007977_014930 [Dactylosporangium sucinum]